MVQKHPKISIITPSLNQAAFIEQTIQSVLNQNYPNLEYIVMDGASTDGTLKILNKYKNRITFISQKDKGQSDAINRGLNLATGDILGYLNSDDFLEKNCLYAVGNFFLNNPKCRWVSGKCNIVDSKGNKVRKPVTIYKNLFLKYMRCLNSLYVLNYISQPVTFWKREIIDEVGFFNRAFHYSMDYDYWLRINKKHKLGFIDNYLASFRVHKNSKGSTNLSGQLNESLQIAKKNGAPGFALITHRMHDIISSCLYINLYQIK